MAVTVEMLQQRMEQAIEYIDNLVAMLEVDEDAQTPGTDTWTLCQQASAFVRDGDTHD